MSHWNSIAATRWTSFVRNPRERRGSKALIGHAIIATRVRLGSEQREGVTVKPHRYRPAWPADRFINRTTPASPKTSIQGENNLQEPLLRDTHIVSRLLSRLFLFLFPGPSVPFTLFFKALPNPQFSATVSFTNSHISPIPPTKVLQLTDTTVVTIFSHLTCQVTRFYQILTVSSSLGPKGSLTEYYHRCQTHTLLQLEHRNKISLRIIRDHTQCFEDLP